MFAYVYASGLIEFGAKVPEGAIALASGPEQKLKDYFDSVCRHGYSTKLVEGRPTKIPGTETLLVPGIPEAPDQAAGMKALMSFRAWMRAGAFKAGLTVASILLALSLGGVPDAQARGYHHFHYFGFTSFPSHWLLDKGPRIISTDGVDMGTYDGPAVVISKDHDDRPAAEAEAIVGQIACRPVRLWTDAGLTLYPAMGCSRGR